jgi:thiamine pyrophosphokinase
MGSADAGHTAADRPPSPGRHVVVLVGGEPAEHRVPALPPDAYVIAADSGLHLADALGLAVHLVVGDLDSADPARLAAARAAGTEVERHPVDKDRTDLALALGAAGRFAPARVTLVGGHGGRLDHLLGNALVLAADEYRDLELTAHVGRATVTVVRGTRRLAGTAGEFISLLPAHGAVHGVTTQGLRFPLDDETLPAGTSRGLSNVFVDEHASVTVRGGVLLAVQPGQA